MKLFKLFSPLSLVILVVALFVVFGNGCALVTKKTEVNIPAKNAVSGIPMLDVTSPALISTTTADKITISGKTDQKKVTIMDMPFDVSRGTFDALIMLTPGEHKVPVSVGNGLTTTTISLQITRE